MNVWLKVAGLAKLFFFEFIAVFFLASALGAVGKVLGFLGCAPDGPLSGYTVAFFLIAFASAAWIIWRIFWPKEITSDFRPNIRIGPLIISNPTIQRVYFPFVTTHPFYVFIDLFVLLTLIPLFVLGQTSPSLAGCGALGSYLTAHIGFFLALLFPFLRLFSWYVLRRRPTSKACIGAVKSVLIFLSIIAPLYLFGFFIFFQGWMREQRLPLVDSSSFAGGLIRHPELVDQLVRVHGTSKQVARCACTNVKDPNDCNIISSLMDVGDGGEIVVHTYGQDATHLYADIMKSSKKSIETVGRLSVLPDPTKKPWAEQDCGWKEFPEVPAQGRAFLEIEYP